MKNFPFQLFRGLYVVPQRWNARALMGVFLMFSSIVRAGADTNSAIVWGGTHCEISLAEVSDRTAQLVIAPLDDHGQPRPIPPTAAFVAFPTAEKFHARELAGAQQVQVGEMRFVIKAPPLTISAYRADGSLVQEFVLDEGTNGTVSFHTDAPVFGLGEGQKQFDRRGHFYPMINGQRNPMLEEHGATIPVPFLIGADGWSFFVRAPWGQFDLRGKQGLFLPDRRQLGCEPLTIYLSELNQPTDALTEYIRLTGHAVMPPKWTMGYMQSCRTIQGPDDPERIAQRFLDDQLPVDAFIFLGTGYCPLGWNMGHGSLTFNPKSFPHPAKQIQGLHDLHFKVVLHINNVPPNLFGTSMTETSSSPAYIDNYWKPHVPDMKLGVDAWWPDDGDELSIESRLARHLCYYEGPLQVHPDLRPWSLHRNAYAGAARYGGWIWSGDIFSRWATLATQVSVGLNSSLSLTPFWGTDTGGFIPTPELTRELYTRWFEFSTFCPLFRSHGVTWHLRLPWGWDTGEPGPVESQYRPDPAELHNAQVEPICREYLDLRYRLLPYNYTLMRESVDTGIPAMRALWLYYPNDPEAVKLGDEYLWGRDFLIAPVMTKSATRRHLYLPAGTWFDWWTDEKVAGGKWVDRPVDLATMPIYVRAGSIIPLDPERQYTSQPVTKPTTLRVYPGADGTFTLYDDDGKSLGYRNSSDTNMIWIRMHWNDQAQRLTLEPAARMKKWPGIARDFTVQLAGAGAKPQNVRFNGKKIEVKF